VIEASFVSYDGCL